MSTRASIISVIILGLTAVSASAITYVVKPDGTGDFATIQDGINGVTGGDILLLSNGTFTGVGNREIDFLGKAVTVCSQSGIPDSCVIDCESAARGFLFVSGEEFDSVLDGVTITHASGPGGIEYGGGILCNNSSPTISGCVFRENDISYIGGGLAALHASPTIDGCLFSMNTSQFGAGIYCGFSNSVITNCIFSENQGSLGGGMFLTYCGTTVTGCRFTDNLADRGGAVCINAGGGDFIQCAFTGNSAAIEGGMLKCNYAFSSFNLCTVYANSSPLGSGARLVDNSELTFSYTIIAGGVGGTAMDCEAGSNATLSCSDVYGNAGGDWVDCLAGQEGTNGNIWADPLFCDAPDGNFYLAIDSPCLIEPCGQMGAFPFGCLGETPTIMTILDVDNDQGRQVRVKWFASSHDAVGEPVITEYALYRRQDQSRRGEREEGWDYLFTIPATSDSIYQCVAPTLCDSTFAEGICWSNFYLRALTPDPPIYYQSMPDSGYSIDNLAPTPPENLRFETPDLLAWDEAQDEDFNYFSVYGSETSEFEGAGLIDQIIETELDVSGTDYGFYHVTTTDFAGNEGNPSTVESETSGLPDSAEPLKYFALRKIHPNPTAAATRIAFDLPRESDLNIKVYNVAGRCVRTLFDGTHAPGSHTLTWALRDENGLRIAAGVYVVSLEAGDFAESRKLIVVE